MADPRRPGDRFAVIVMFLGLVAFAPGGAIAASCAGNSHDLSLTDGSVSPRSGTTSTSFTFQVSYTDNAGCTPTRIVAVVDGVRDIDLTHGRGALANGAVFEGSAKLPVGRHDYWFEAASGTGAGQRAVKLANVDPPTVIVSDPEPPPDKATPRPEKPTPEPAKPTPAPEATRAPGRKPTESADETPAPSRRPEPTASGDLASSPPGTPSPSPTPVATPSSGSGSTGTGGGGPATVKSTTFDDVPRPLLALVVASLATVGGLVAFAILGTWLADPMPRRFAAGIGRRGRRGDPASTPER